jgi:hypothetical protein
MIALVFNVKAFSERLRISAILQADGAASSRLMTSKSMLAYIVPDSDLRHPTMVRLSAVAR